MAMKQQRFRRRKKVIKPGFQLKFAFSIVGFLLVYSLILGSAVFFSLASEIQASATIEDQARVAFVVLGLHETLWPALIGILALTFVGAVLYSHRIAGPLYRLEKTVELFMSGDFTQRVRLRKADELKEIETVLNRFAEYLEKVQQADAVFHGSLKERLAQAVHELAKTQGNEATSAKAIAESLIDELEVRHDAFKTPSA